MTSFQNRVAVIINAPFFERDLRKKLNRRCDYLKLLDFITEDPSKSTRPPRKNGINSEYRLNELVRAIYFHSEMIYKAGKFERRNSANHNNFLNALRSMGYEPTSTYNSVDAGLVTAAIELAHSGAIDTMLILGIPGDYVPMINHVRAQGVRVIGLFPNTYDLSERIKNAVNWFHEIKVEDGFLTDELPSYHEEESEELPPGDERDRGQDEVVEPQP